MSRMFNPGQGGGEGGDTIPAGQYLLAMTGFRRAVSKAGRPYLRCRYEVLHGAKAKRTFWAVLSLNLESPAVAGRLGVYCACIGQGEPFDLDSDGACRKAFLFKPFKAEVSVRTEGQYTNNDIARYLKNVSPVEETVMAQWVLDREAELDPQADDPAADEDQDPIPF